MPLKIGIFEDLVPHVQELDLTESVLRDAIRIWCRGTRYRTCLVEGAARGSGGSAGGTRFKSRCGPRPSNCRPVVRRERNLDPRLPRSPTNP
ncbi:ProQ/FINO family protein [Cupriavidus sp. 8B]